VSEITKHIESIVNPIIDKKLKSATAEKSPTFTPILEARGQGVYLGNRTLTEIDRTATNYNIPSDSDPAVYVTVEPPTEVVFLDSLTGGTVVMTLDPPAAPGP